MSFFDVTGRPAHFYVIRSVESRLMREYLEGCAGPFLDLGCGDGAFAASLELKGEVYGVDIADAMLISARAGVYVKAMKANAARLPFEDGFFGAIFSNCAVEHMDSLADVLRETRRVLRPGGVFAFTAPTANFLDAVREDAFLKEIGLNTDERLREYNERHHHVNMLDAQEWLRLLEENGFEDIAGEGYLPEPLGSFVARMDMLYTIETRESREMKERLETAYFAPGSAERDFFDKYIKDPHTSALCTHAIFKAR
jgi:SAM-dependent methyltransferase